MCAVLVLACLVLPSLQVNVRSLELSTLYRIEGSRYNVTIGNESSNVILPDQGMMDINGMTVEMAAYFDDRYPHMEPVHCGSLHQAGGSVRKDFCLLEQGHTYAYPLFNHFGDYVNITDPYPEICDW